MIYQYKVMTQEQAEDIAFNWYYNGEYSFYNIDADEEDLAEFLDPDKRGNSTFTVIKENEMVGFFSVNEAANKAVDIGLGMRPDFTGKGEGIAFLKAGLDFVQVKFEPKKITLSVATFNQRAIKVYRKVGFKDLNMFMQDTNGSTFEFLRMEYECE